MRWAWSSCLSASPQLWDQRTEVRHLQTVLDSAPLTAGECASARSGAMALARGEAHPQLHDDEHLLMVNIFCSFYANRCGSPGAMPTNARWKQYHARKNTSLIPSYQLKSYPAGVQTVETRTTHEQLCASCQDYLG